MKLESSLGSWSESVKREERVPACKSALHEAGVDGEGPSQVASDGAGLWEQTSDDTWMRA